MIVPGEFEIHEDPTIAAKKRQMSTVAMLSATATGKTKKIKANRVPTYTGRRPNISLMGAQMRAPTAKPNRYVVRPSNDTVELGTLSSAVMPCVPEMPVVYADE